MILAMPFQRFELPGPAQFLSRVASDLRQAKNVVVCLPALNPGDVLSAIGRRLEGSWRWEKYVPDSDLYPLDQLQKRLSLDDERDEYGGGTELRDLTAHDTHEGLVVAVDLDGRSNTDRWCRFIRDYSEHLRHTDDAEWPRFIFQIKGEEVRSTPDPGVHLSIRNWKNVTREIDVRHVVEREMETRGLAPLQHRLAVEMIVRLALWDMELAAKLSRLSLREISRPVSLLKEYAEDRGWTREESATWVNGIRETFLGEKQIHSALHAVRGNLSIIERRIWAAQTAVMFPFLEARLRDLLEGLDCLPDSTTDDQNGIISKEEFELSHVRSELEKDGRASPQLKAIVDKLKKVRNRIAHLEPLRPSDLEESFSQFKAEVERN